MAVVILIDTAWLQRWMLDGMEIALSDRRMEGFERDARERKKGVLSEQRGAAVDEVEVLFYYYRSFRSWLPFEFLPLVLRS